MAFSWILGRRDKYLEDVAEDEAWPPNEDKANSEVQHQDNAINLADIKLSIEDGLVMAFGPLGDPVTPELLKDACARQPRATLRLPNGDRVDHERLIAVIEAQQAGKLAEYPDDRWIGAMLGAEGRFEVASPECLASEEAEGKSVVAGRLVLDMPGSETITLHDAHPGSSGSGLPARLMVDGKPVSITELVGRFGRTEPCDSLRSVSNPVVSFRDDSLALLLDGEIEARLETASSAWDGESKVAVFLEDGRPVSVDDLAKSLRDLSPPLPTEFQVTAATYPLFSDDEPLPELEHATIVTVSDVPNRWSLTTGKRNKQGAWVLDPSSLMDAAVRASGPYQGAQTLRIKVISTVGHDGTLDHETRTVVIPPTTNGNTKPAPSSPALDEQETSPSSIPLTFDEVDASKISLADALLLKGIPEGTSLSGGVFDPSLKGWVLKPSHLARLAIQDLDHHFGAFEIELKAFYLDPKGQARSDIILSKIITNEHSSKSSNHGEDLAQAQSR